MNLITRNECNAYWALISRLVLKFRHAFNKSIGSVVRELQAKLKCAHLSGEGHSAPSVQIMAG